MLNKRRPELNDLVWDAASRVGHNAPKIADDIIASTFPRTHAEAMIEGADKLLRDGLIATVKGILRTSGEPDGQVDFAEIDPSFRPLVQGLKRPSYYAESRGEYVSLADLIAEPTLLDDARKYLRRKGDECIAEASRLDQLYAAVVEASAA